MRNRPALLALLVSTSAAAQAPAPVAAPNDFLILKNDSAATVQVELLRPVAPGSREAYAQVSACLDAQQSVYWPLASPVGRIRMQAMRGKECGKDQPATCELSIDRAPGMRSVSLKVPCAIVPAPLPPQGALKAGGNRMCGDTGNWAPLTFTNKDPKRAMWLTVYTWHSGLAPFPIRMSGCWLPGERRMACLDPRRVVLQAEMTQGQNNQPAVNCNGPVTCKTRMDTDRRSLKPQHLQPPNGQTVDLHPNGTNCYWDYIRP